MWVEAQCHLYIENLTAVLIGLTPKAFSTLLWAAWLHRTQGKFLKVFIQEQEECLDIFHASFFLGRGMGGNNTILNINT